MNGRRWFGVVMGAFALLVTACPPQPGAPVTTTTAGPAWIELGTCFQHVSATEPLYFEYVGPENTTGNLRLHSVGAGDPCSSPTSFLVTVVRAADQAAADQLCGRLEPWARLAVRVADSPVTFAPAFPADAWGCTAPSPLLS